MSERASGRASSRASEGGRDAAKGGRDVDVRRQK